VLTLSLTGAASSSTASAPDVRSASGITILGPLPATPPPLPTNLALALDDANRASAADPQNLAFPWVDRSSGTVVVPAATAAGTAKATGFRSARATAAPTRVVTVKHSRAYLQKIMDDTIGLTASAKVQLTQADPANDRAILWLDAAPTDSYLRALASRYDPSAIAVYVLQHPYTDSPLFGRNGDSSPFWGGARIYTSANMACTDAFSWTDGSSNYYSLTAGHCAAEGGSVSTPSEAMGLINACEASWTYGVGTVSMCGQTEQRGDIALIRITPGLLSSANMYRGGFGSTSWATVKEMWNRSPQPGDQYCTGGATTGELCGWVTQQVGVNYAYTNGEVARNIDIGTRTAPCLDSGDSGGPVYTVRSDGGIAAKGIISGGGVASQCRNEYTDIYQALYGFVGWLATG
jgi:hypothetical protein